MSCRCAHIRTYARLVFCHFFRLGPRLRLRVLVRRNGASLSTGVIRTKVDVIPIRRCQIVDFVHGRDPNRNFWQKTGSSRVYAWFMAAISQGVRGSQSVLRAAGCRVASRLLRSAPAFIRFYYSLLSFILRAATPVRELAERDRQSNLAVLREEAAARCGA